MATRTGSVSRNKIERAAIWTVTCPCGQGDIGKKHGLMGGQLWDQKDIGKLGIEVWSRCRVQGVIRRKGISEDKMGYRTDGSLFSFFFLLSFLVFFSSVLLLLPLLYVAYICVTCYLSRITL